MGMYKSDFFFLKNKEPFICTVVKGYGLREQQRQDLKGLFMEIDQFGAP